MNILISMEHPAWVHQFNYIIKTLEKNRHTVTVLAVDKDRDLELLDYYGIKYILTANSTGKNVVEKGFLFIGLSIKYTYYAFKYKADILIGRASPMMAIAAFFKRKKHVLYEDTEVSKFSLKICKRFSDTIITPKSFLTDLGAKQKRVDTFKELFYLSDDCFTPNKKLLIDNGFNANEKYIILRLVSFNASHDFGLKGLSMEKCKHYVEQLSKYAKVYVSSETPLDNSLQEYALNTPYEVIHQVLYFAQLCISEGATLASEAAILGTHAIYMNDIVSGTTKELSSKYELMYNYNSGVEKYETALKKACELLNNENLFEEGKEKRKVLLKDKIGINEFYADLIINEVSS